MGKEVGLRPNRIHNYTVIASPRWQRSLQVQTLNVRQRFILVAEALAQFIERCPGAVKSIHPGQARFWWSQS